jgi:hypothetical protein
LLQKRFQDPPPDARILMRWWWFGPAVTHAQLEREMRLMKLGGIGGFEVQPTYPLAPDNAAAGFRNLPFLSDEFIEALRFTSQKARELGLRMDLTLGSGWPYGGPTISIDQAAGRLRTVRTRAVASRRVPLPDLESGEEFIAAFAAPAQEGNLDAQALRQLDSISSGALHLPEDMPLPAEAIFFISSRTGMQVKRPAVGAEGFVLNHLDRPSLDHYLQTVGERLMQAFDSQPPYAIFCDSLEVYQSDWTPDFLQEFEKRRGYDLKPHLPALVLDLGPASAEIRRDWGKTLTELYEERFAAPMQAWARRHNTRFRIQGYGNPPATLSSYIYADLPEGEGHQWRALSTSRWASSAGHLLGHTVISSETWTWLHSPSFRATPLDMKMEADLHFLQGINQLIGHGWPYTAEGVQYPGWRFYAAAVFNDRNPWWIVMPDITLYLQRASFLLRQGQPVQDVLLYLPVDDAYAAMHPGPTELNRVLARIVPSGIIPQILDAGFNFDLIDDGLLERRGRPTKGALVFDTLRYRAAVLPPMDRIPASHAPDPPHLRPTGRDRDRHRAAALPRAGLQSDGPGPQRGPRFGPPPVPGPGSPRDFPSFGRSARKDACLPAPAGLGSEPTRAGHRVRAPPRIRRRDLLPRQHGQRHPKRERHSPRSPRAFARVVGSDGRRRAPRRNRQARKRQRHRPP